MTDLNPSSQILGRVGSPSDGLEIRCTLDQDALQGRVGGIFGKDLKLEILEHGITGSVGGAKGFGVHLELRSGELVGSVGQDPIVLRGVDQVTGRLGDALGGLELSAKQRGQQLVGRIGGLSGKMIELSLDGAPGWIGALCAAIAVHALERHVSR